MRFYFTTIFLIVFQQINKIFAQGLPISPCPKVFQYRYDGTEWFGILSIRSPDFRQLLHIRVTLSMRGKPTTNYLGEIELLTRGLFLTDMAVIYKVKFPYSHFPPKLLQITANEQIVCMGAPDHGIFITQIQLEHTRKLTFAPEDSSSLHLPASHLPSPNLPSSHMPSSHLPSSHPTIVGGLHDAASFLPTKSGFGNLAHRPLATLEKNPMQANKDICGTIDNRISFQVLHTIKRRRNVNENRSTAGGNLQSLNEDDNENGDSLPLITADDVDPYGAQTYGLDNSPNTEDLPTITRGAWPWLAAIYVNNLTSLAYQCGGTLVSNRVVISAAHCFQLPKKRFTSNEVLIFLGRHNLENWNEEDSLSAPVDDIFIHPEFDKHLTSYDADIAILVLKNEINFNIFIRPACLLWSGSSNVEYIEGEQGVVVGWGLGDLSNSAPLKTVVPKILDAPIVSNAVCFKSNEEFRSLSSNRTFCAGLVTNKTSHSEHQHRGPCTGDSGAGLMIYRNNRWVLRGTVSAALPTVTTDSKQRKLSCTNNQYVIYTDVSKFLEWILVFLA